MLQSLDKWEVKILNESIEKAKNTKLKGYERLEITEQPTIYDKSVNFNTINDPKKRASFYLTELQKKLAKKCIFCENEIMELKEGVDWKRRPLICFRCLTTLKNYYVLNPNSWAFSEVESE